MVTGAKYHKLQGLTRQLAAEVLKKKGDGMIGGGCAVQVILSDEAAGTTWEIAR